MTDMREDERERIGCLANEICGCSTLEQHRRDIALIEAEIDRRVAEERAKLLERLRDLAAGPAAWLDSWAMHTGNCNGGYVCTCGLTLARTEAEQLLAQFEKENSHEQG